MKTQKSNEIKLAEPPLLSSKLYPSIVKLAKYLKENKYARKSVMRDYIGVQASTFEIVVKFLVNLSVIREQVKYPLYKKNKEHMGRKQKYLMWVWFETGDILESIEALTAYNNIDLSQFPIRNLDTLHSTEIELLKKYLFRVMHKAVAVPNDKVARIFDLLSDDIGCPINSITRAYKMVSPVFYGCLKALIDRKKVELGVDKKMRVVIYQNPQWNYLHKQWKCENCGKWNVGSNSTYCGQCGDVREATNE